MSNSDTIMKQFAILDHMPIGAFVLQKDFVVMFWNSLLEDWTGIARSKIIGKHIGTYFPHLNTPKYAIRIQDVLNNGMPFVFSSYLHQYVIPVTLPDNQMQIQSTTVTRVPGLNGTDCYALFSIQDVTELTHRIRDYRMMRDQAQKEIKEREQAEKRLKESEDRLCRVVENIPVLMVAFDENKNIIVWNRECERVTGYSAAEIIGNSRALELLYPDPAYRGWALAKLTQQTNELYNLELKLISKDGTPKIVVWSNASGLFPIPGWTMWATGVDITERKQAGEALRQRNCESAILNQMSNLLQECRAEEETYNVLVSVCRELFPSDSGCLYMIDNSKTMLDVVMSWGSSPPRSQAFGVDDCWSLCNGTSLLVKNPNTKPLCAHLLSSPSNGYLCVPIDTSEQILGVLHLCFGPREPGYSDEEYRHLLESKRMVATRVTEHYALSLANLRLRETLKKESIHDPLTALYNRRYMEESLKLEACRAKRNHTSIGIIIIGIDHFKLFNDTHGHKAGDVVLQELGVLLQSNSRGGDIACRYGGGEFLLILPDTILQIAEKRAKELLQQVRDLEITYQNKSFHITVSIGVSALSEDSPGVQEVINAADKALYQAKERGRNQVAVASPT